MESTPQHYLVTPLAYTGAAIAFTYHAEAVLPIGQIVAIPLGRRRSLGVVTATTNRPTFATKPALPLDLPPLPTYLISLAEWLASYYAASPAAVWSALLPAGLAKTRRIIKTPASTQPAHGLPAHPLTDEQAAVLSAIRTSEQSVHLIQGVTGSGKTRLYLELAAEALATGHSVIVLVPEITLTPQVVGQFEQAFGPLVLTTHSKLTESQRDHIWRAAMSATAAGEQRVIVGPRSSLFLPLHQLGLIIVDESHENSYKQEQHPRYHVIPTAAQLSRLTGARVVLGSATPSLGELFLASEGKISRHVLTKRVHDKPLPQATIIDLRDKSQLKTSKFIAQPLIDAVTATLEAGRQSVLYLNRRGSASSQVCADCGHVTTCPHCQLPLTFHADLMRLVCHHCNYRQALPAVCPNCAGADLRLLGGGTKRVEAEAARLWPGARLARLDKDSANLKTIQSVYRDLAAGRLDIVIGTQMVAKGLDLPAVDTVGVISADTTLHLPDFGAAERTYQLLAQVSGRAGRGDRPGQVFIQTFTPDHPAIQAAATGDTATFIAAELEQRRSLRYPPFAYLLKLELAAPTREAAQSGAQALADQLRAHPGLEIAGPAPAFIETAGGRYRWVITVKSHRRPPLVQIARQLPSDRWTADLDPGDLL